MAKLVDAPSSGGGAARCAGSNPVPGTTLDFRQFFSELPFLVSSQTFASGGIQEIDY